MKKALILVLKVKPLSRRKRKGQKAVENQNTV